MRRRDGVRLGVVSVCAPLDVPAKSASLRLVHGTTVHDVCVPPDVNRIVSVDASEHTVTLHCEHPHGLFVQSGGVVLLAPRHVPLLLAPAMVSLDDLDVLQHVQCVSPTALRLPLRVREQLLPDAALCYRAGATAELLVRTIADRMPQGCRLSHCEQQQPSIRLQSQAGLALQVSGGLAALLNLQRTGDAYVGYDVAPTRHCEWPEEVDLDALCEVTERTEAAAISDGSLEFELPHRRLTAPLPQGTYDLETAARVLDAAVRTECELRVTATEAGLKFSAPFDFGVRMDTVEGLSCWQLGYMPAALRGCRTYVGNVDPRLVLPLSAARPRLRVAARDRRVYACLEPLPPVPARKRGSALTLEHALPAAAGTALSLTFADCTELAVVKEPHGLRMSLEVASARSGECTVQLINWVDHLDAHIGWLQANERLRIGISTRCAALPAVLEDADDAVRRDLSN
jgi:hypothetical protein